jgi:hypothetical protein
LMPKPVVMMVAGPSSITDGNQPST